jgi:hypothetical protein
MKKIAGIIILCSIVGYLYGFVKITLTIAPYTEPAAFRALSILDQRDALSDLVGLYSFARVLEFLRTVYPLEDPSVHGVGHVLGEVAYMQYGYDAFAQCDNIFNYGCYHGVVDMAIRIQGKDDMLMQNLWNTCVNGMSDSGPCLHPLGHASTILAQYDILEAFGRCDSLFTDPQYARECWNGAMMEYINRSSPGAPNASYGDPNDPYYPCDTYPERYKGACVSMHAHYLFSVWGNDVGKLLSFCLSYPHNLRQECTREAGIEAAETYFLRADETVRVCKEDARYSTDCLMGAATRYGSAGQFDKANMQCEAIDENDLQQACYQRIKDSIIEEK